MTQFRRHTDAGVIRPRSSATTPVARGGSSRARTVGALGMIGLIAVLFWLLTDDAFRVTEDSIAFTGLQYADEAAVRDHLSGIDRAPNIFRVRASDIVADVSELPDVDAASATVMLPATVQVRLDERDPLFVWSDGEVAWLVDEEGMLFGPTGSYVQDEVAGEIDGETIDEAPDLEASLDALASRGDLPIVEDARLVAERPTVGAHLDEADLAIMRQLLALTPELLGSGSERLSLRVDDGLGYILTSDKGWQAVFGRYSPRVQPPTTIPRQVQCLQALLAQKERKLARVRLSIAETACGTYTEFD